MCGSHRFLYFHSSAKPNVVSIHDQHVDNIRNMLSQGKRDGRARPQVRALSRAKRSLPTGKGAALEVLPGADSYSFWFNIQN